MNARSRQDIRRFDRAVLLFCLVALGVSVAYPTARMLLEAGRAWRFEVIRESAGYGAVRNTLLISLASVLSAGLAGTALAFFFTRVAFRGRSLAAALAYLPFALPPLVGVLSFYFLIGPGGLAPRMIQRLFGGGEIALSGAAAVLLVHTHAFFVFFYATVSSALESLDYAQVEAARTLGSGHVRVFLRVLLPQLSPALLSAALLTFMSSAASFSAPFFLGGNMPMLSVEVYHKRIAGDDGAALTLSVCLAAVSLLGVLLFRRTRQPGRAASKGAPRPLRTRAGRFGAACLAWCATGLLLMPHLALIWLSLIDYRAWNTQLVPTRFTLMNYVEVFRHSGALAPIGNSLWMSAAGTAAVVVIGAPAAYLIARKRPWRGVVNFLVMIPWALPGTVIAMNLIVAFNDPWLPLANTVWLLPIAYYIRGAPLFTRMAAAAIEPFDAALLEAGQTLGASRAYCFRRIVLPLLAPAIAAATALVFATSLGEFVASILLCTAANKPVSVKIGEILHDSLITGASAYSVLLMLLVAGVFLAGRRFSTRVF
ncbi:MAG: iron ABC transporter permease [Candidatus Hydrogenedentes bacterium]|nr:iron ABC transporter permease [Candidatus Hydrogenedentota bacterium]